MRAFLNARMQSAVDASTPETVIALRCVSKSFALWEDSTDRLLAPLKLLVGLKNHVSTRQFTAVRDISLEITRGECLGIIGRNGAGKSTLLQMIAGTLQPTSGEITVRGRVAALLELGSGFNPDFTGRENIHLNAAILGLSSAEIAGKFDSIVEYSGIAEFIDQPVRTYSSGMAIRLAFAVCVHVDAEILIIDEALAVGDARFQFKCHATLDRMIKEGRTIIFVSHDTNAVKRMCNSAVLLERGEMVLKAEPNVVTNIYTKLITSPHGLEAIREELEAARTAAPNTPRLSAAPPPAPPVESTSVPGSQLLVEERAHQQVSDREYSYGGIAGKITAAELLRIDGSPSNTFRSGEALRVRIRCRAQELVPDPIFAITIKDVRGQEIFGTNTYFQNQTLSSLQPGDERQVDFELQANLLPGVYFISLGWVRLQNGDVEVIHRRYDSLRMEVFPTDRSFGIAYCPTKIDVH